jgi:Zn-dependent protease with chaperone function
MATDISLAGLIAALLLIIPARRGVIAWARRLENSDLPDAEKAHRLRRVSVAVSLGILPVLVLSRVLAAMGNHPDHGRHHSSGAAGFAFLTFLVLLFGMIYAVSRPVRNSLERIRGVQLLFATVLLYSARAKPMPSEYVARFEHLAEDMGVKVAGFKVIPGRQQRLANAMQIGGIPRYRFIAVTDYLTSWMPWWHTSWAMWPVIMC